MGWKVGVDGATRGARKSAHAVAGRVPARAEGLCAEWETAGRRKRNVACAAYLRKDTVFFPARQLFPPRIFDRRKA